MREALTAAFPSLLLDMVLLFLLLCAILYAIRLNRSVRAVHLSKAELAWLFARFAEHIARAEKVVADLKRHAQEAQERHDKRREQAERLESDLGYLLAKGNHVADQLEATLSGATQALRSTRDKQPPGRQTRVAETTQEVPAVASLAQSKSLPSLHNLR